MLALNRREFVQTTGLVMGGGTLAGHSLGGEPPEALGVEDLRVAGRVEARPVAAEETVAQRVRVGGEEDGAAARREGAETGREHGLGALDADEQQLEGVADGGNRDVYRWGADAMRYRPRRREYVLLYRRRP